MQVLTVLSMFLGYVSALPVYKAPMAFGGNSGGYNHGKGMDNGPGGTGGTGAIIPNSGPWGGIPIAYSSSYDQEGGEGEGEGGEGGFVSSSDSDYDSTPSDGGGDTNPTTPTLPPGGDPTTASNPIPLKVQKGGVKAVGMVLGLGLVVGVSVGAGIYIIKKKG